MPQRFVYLDVVVILEAILDMSEELKDVQPVNASVKQGVHALKSGLAKVEAIINFVLERSHLNL